MESSPGNDGGGIIRIKLSSTRTYEEIVNDIFFHMTIGPENTEGTLMNLVNFVCKVGNNNEVMLCLPKRYDEIKPLNSGTIISSPEKSERFVERLITCFSNLAMLEEKKLFDSDAYKNGVLRLWRSDDIYVFEFFTAKTDQRHENLQSLFVGFLEEFANGAPRYGTEVTVSFLDRLILDLKANNGRPSCLNVKEYMNKEKELASPKKEHSEKLADMNKNGSSNYDKVQYDQCTEKSKLEVSSFVTVSPIKNITKDNQRVEYGLSSDRPPNSPPKILNQAPRPRKIGKMTIHDSQIDPYPPSQSPIKNPPQERPRGNIDNYPPQERPHGNIDNYPSQPNNDLSSNLSTTSLVKVTPQQKIPTIANYIEQEEEQKGEVAAKMSQYGSQSNNNYQQVSSDVRNRNSEMLSSGGYGKTTPTTRSPEKKSNRASIVLKENENMLLSSDPKMPNTGKSLSFKPGDFKIDTKEEVEYLQGSNDKFSEKLLIMYIEKTKKFLEKSSQKTNNKRILSVGEDFLQNSEHHLKSDFLTFEILLTSSIVMRSFNKPKEMCEYMAEEKLTEVTKYKDKGYTMRKLYIFHGFSALALSRLETRVFAIEKYVVTDITQSTRPWTKEILHDLVRNRLQSGN
jgi:hypothetical protein